MQAEHSARVRAIVPDVVAERIVAVAVVFLGTMLNGYGTPPQQPTIFAPPVGRNPPYAC